MSLSSSRAHREQLRKKGLKKALPKGNFYGDRGVLGDEALEPEVVSSAVYGIDKPLTPGIAYEGMEAPLEVEVEVELPGEEGLEAAEEALPAAPPHDANLAEFLDEDRLREIGNRLKELYDSDLESRADWEDTYRKGLDLLGLKIEDRAEPFQGACGVTHPMILESAVRFQSKASTRLFPAKGPADVRVWGTQTEEALQASKRVAQDLNYYCTEKMSEYFPDTEQMLFSLPIAGSAFRRVYFDYVLERPCACFVPASDFVMPAGFPNLETCPRYSYVCDRSHSDLRRLALNGYYLDLDLDRTTISTERTDIEDAEAKLTGVRPSEIHNELVKVVETHFDSDEFSDLEGGEERVLPYVITWELSTLSVLAIRRNWREPDTRRAKIMHFVHYRYVPGLASYGYGLIHLIGGVAKASTSVLRQLIDAGTLANLPGGLKARSLRIKGDGSPIQPGEWRDVDVASPKISDSLYPMPYKEPSPTLLQLFDRLAQDGKTFASIADLDLGAASANAPVGTILALIERAAEVITAVQARLHQTFKQELNLLADCIREHQSEAYDYDVSPAPREIKQQDFARRMQIRPTSDPSSATTAQRVMQLQAAMQFSAQAPEIYDIPKLHRQMLSTLGIEPPEDLVPEEETPAMDPVSENMALLTSKPVKAYEHQDHTSHITVHMAFAADGQLQQMLQQSPSAASVTAAMSAHIADHVAMEYRKQIEAQLGVPLPPLGEPLPPEVEERVASLEAQAAQKLAAKRAADQQAQQAQQQAADPVFQLEQARVQLEAQRDQGKLQVAAAGLQQKAAAAQQAEETKRIDIATKASQAEDDLRIEQQKLRIDLLELRQKLQLALRKLDIEQQKADKPAPAPGGPFAGN